MKRAIFAFLGLFLYLPKPAWSCAVCFGDPNSPLSHGVTLGVIFLLTITASVLGSIAVTGIIWARRARKLGQITH